VLQLGRTGSGKYVVVEYTVSCRGVANSIAAEKSVGCEMQIGCVDVRQSGGGFGVWGPPSIISLPGYCRPRWKEPWEFVEKYE
jgi:hypothetical protein